MTRQWIQVDGGEGSGKTSFCKRLEAEEGFELVKLPTPGSKWEAQIFDSDNDLETKAYAATMDMIERMDDLLERGVTKAVFDRGPLSTYAYQSPTAASEALKKHALDYCGLFTHAYVLDVDTELGLAREDGKNAVSYENIEFHQRVNNRMRLIGYLLSDSKGSTNSSRQWRQIFWGLKDAALIDTNHSTAEQTYDQILSRIYH